MIDFEIAAKKALDHIDSIDHIDSQFEILQYKLGVMDIGSKGLNSDGIDSYSSYSKKTIMAFK